MISEQYNRSENTLILIKGILCVALGIISIVLRYEPFTSLAYYVALALLLNGLLSLIAMVYAGNTFRIGIFHYEGLVSMVLGVVVLNFPEMAVAIFMHALGVFTVGTGLVMIALAFDLKNFRVKEDLLIYSGIMAVILGMIVFRNPASITEFINVIAGLALGITGSYTVHAAYKTLQKQSAARVGTTTTEIRFQPHITYSVNRAATPGPAKVRQVNPETEVSVSRAS
jgi:uncharacterized membrane protein HdeD (DUF308 family)